MTRYHVNGRNAMIHPSRANCPSLVRLLSDTPRTLFDHKGEENSCIKDNWRTCKDNDGDETWSGKTFFRLKQRHQNSMSADQRRSFQVSFSKHVKTKTYYVERERVKHQHIKQSLNRCDPKTEDCPKLREADGAEAIHCAKSLNARCR